MSINLADNNPRIEYTVAEGVTQTSFSVPFEFFDDSDVVIYVDGTLKTEGVDYTLTGGDGATGTAALSVTGASGGSTVVITRRIALERVTDFTAGSDINRAALNQQLDTLVAMAADANDRIDRSIHMPDEDPTDVNFALPAKADRISKYLAFGADGDIALTSGTTSSIVVSTFAETFIDDANGTEVLTTLGVTATPAELNALDGITATVTELNYTDGVTSNIQTQLDAKQGLDATLTALAGLSTGANKIPYSTGTDTFGQLDFLDEDDMSSDSATGVPSQQSVKAYVDVRNSIVAMGLFDGSGTPAWNYRYGFGATITDNGTGDYTIAFDSAESDANYVVQVTAESAGAGGSNRQFIFPYSLTTAGFSIRIVDVSGGALDRDNIHVVVHRLTWS